MALSKENLAKEMEHRCWHVVLRMWPLLRCSMNVILCLITREPGRSWPFETLDLAAACLLYASCMLSFAWYLDGVRCIKRETRGKHRVHWYHRSWQTNI